LVQSVQLVEAAEVTIWGLHGGDKMEVRVVVVLGINQTIELELA